jgi:hypothetical protein
VKDEDVRACVYGVAKEMGFKIQSLNRNPLTGVWNIDAIGYHDQVRFKPTPDASIKECAEQLKSLLHEDVWLR